MSTASPASKVVRLAFIRSYGRCECTHLSHLHKNRCTFRLVWEKRGCESSGGWEVYSPDGKEPESPANCMILCHLCYKKIKDAKK